MLSVERVTKRFGGREVVRDVSFQVRPGEVLGLIGANGAGKSTTLGIVAGTLVPDAGRVAVEGSDEPRTRRAKVGFAPQEAALYPSLTCEEQLRFWGRLYGLPGSAVGNRVEEVMEQTGLRPVRRARTDTLSGGWRRRLSLAVALVHRPRLVLLDEPTSGLDVDARAEVWRRVGALRRDGVAVLLTTHVLEEAEASCDRVAILMDGRIVASGTLAELRALVPASEVAVAQGEDAGRIRERARALGIQVRDYAGQPSLLLPEASTLKALVERLGEVGVRSLTLQPVSLQHVFLEVTGAGGTGVNPP